MKTDHLDFDRYLLLFKLIYSMIIVVYFAFTTLSTIGFGDYHAISTHERIICSLILLFGVAMFSFIMGNFIEILMSFKHVTAENEESENLTKFLIKL